MFLSVHVYVSLIANYDLIFLSTHYDVTKRKPLSGNNDKWTHAFIKVMVTVDDVMTVWL